MKIWSATLVAIAGLAAKVDCRDDGIRGALKIGQEGGGHSSVNPNVKLSSDSGQKHDNVLKDSGNAVDRESYIVAFKDKTDFPSKRCEALSKRNGGSSLQAYGLVLNGGCSMMLPEAAANALKKNPQVSRVEKDAKVEISFNETIPTSIQDEQVALSETTSVPSWGLDRINQCGLPLDDRATKLDATGVRVYIVDSGIQADHADIAGVISHESCHINAANYKQFDPLVDTNGHGTFVASVACGNTYGVAANCEVCSVKVSPGNVSNIIGGIDKAARNCLKSRKRCVINMSFAVELHGLLNEAVAEVVANNIVVVAAAGNEGVDACGWSPASESTVITVGASTPDDTIASFSNWGSNYGECVDVFAPGSDITAAFPTSTSTTSAITGDGTSFASPHVAGIAANILRMNPDATPAEVKDKITDTTSKLDGKEKVATIGCTCSPETQDATCPPSISGME